MPSDLSYDFITRPGYHHALVTQDTEFLRLTLRLPMEIGVDQTSPVHALQNHDELAYELVHFATRHKDDQFQLAGNDRTGSELAEHIQYTLRDELTGDNGPYNAVFTTNGIACTTVSVITAALGIRDLAALTPERVETVKEARLLLAMYIALQPACSRNSPASTRSGVMICHGQQAEPALEEDLDGAQLVTDLLQLADPRRLRTRWSSVRAIPAFTAWRLAHS